ncbi:MAG: UDP-N-acetylmuramate--L-alanine ligase [Desulfurivibrionaceae bacterium]
MYQKNKHIHFVGIGGIGMSGIAELLLNLGYKVSGSDLKESTITRRLQDLGGIVHPGHDPSYISGAEVLVTSSAVGRENPEVKAALDQQIPVIPRAEMLAELMRLKKYGIAIAGSHGKTSTTSLVSWILAAADFDPTVVIGGQVDSLGSNAKMGTGEFLVAEADESDGSFLHLAPVLEVVTNIDLEHLEYYKDLEEIKKIFLEFIHKVPFYGAAVLCRDDANIVELLPHIRKRVITYGLDSQADLQARNLRTEGFATTFQVWWQDRELGEVKLGLPGTHNVLNSLAAIAVSLELEIPFAVIAGALATFSGVQRRLQIKGKKRDITVIDDYGHHPTEIKAILSTLREVWPEHRLVVFFQPHRYSRTKALFQDFSTAFQEADLLYVTEIYAAGEQPLPGISGRSLCDAMAKAGKNACFVEDPANFGAYVTGDLEKGDIVLTLGAGDVWKVGEEILYQMVEAA